MGRNLQLSEVLQKLDSFEQEDTIYAEMPWKGTNVTIWNTYKLLSKMAFKDFFNFRSNLDSSTFQAGPVDMSINERKLIRGDYDGISFPITFKHDFGENLCDLIDAGFPALYLISERLKIFFEENGFSGWKIFFVKLLDKKGNEIQGYYGLSITGRCGPVDYSKCEIIKKSKGAKGPVLPYYIGFPIGLDKWDGSDFFLPGDSVGIVVNRRVADLLKAEKFTNVHLRNIIETETSAQIVEKFYRK